MWEIEVLDALQNIHTPWLDKIMVAITSLGNAGILWIVMAAVLLIIPSDQKSRNMHGYSIGTGFAYDQLPVKESSSQNKAL